MTAFIIAIVITVIAAWLIVKNYQPQTVLLLAGLALLTITVLFYPENSILYDKAKSTGSTWLDIFSFAKESLTTQIAGIGLIIMAAGDLPAIWITLKRRMRWSICAFVRYR
ncbi:Putative cryptic C4-dicarboxylate transporter DcuD [Citrobacter youngae]|nr:Putative cryptic C4-dicarboxylate transporter DcuD [Citrobacter youngae]